MPLNSQLHAPTACTNNSNAHGLSLLYRDNAKATADLEATTGQVKQAQDVVAPMERLVKGLEQQQADAMK